MEDAIVSGGLTTLLLGGLTLIGACATQAPPIYVQLIHNDKNELTLSYAYVYCWESVRMYLYCSTR